VISHQHRCVFIHIPKTAGQSVEHVFLDLAGLTWETRDPLVLRANDNPELGPPRLAHLTASEYVDCGYLTPEQFSSYYKFSFVRNPWDRLVSEYKYRGYPVKIDFKTYLARHLPSRGWTDNYRHIIPQYEFLHDSEGRRLVDFVGRYETLQADFDRVCRDLAIPRRPLPRVNRSLEEQQPPTTYRELRKRIRRAVWSHERKHTFGHYTEYYDEESRDLVAEMFRKDIEAFSYSFGDGVGATAPASS